LLPSNPSIVKNRPYVRRSAQNFGDITWTLKRRQLIGSLVLPEAPHFWVGDPLDEPGSYPGFLAPRLLRFLEQRL